MARHSIDEYERLNESPEDLRDNRDPLDDPPEEEEEPGIEDIAPNLGDLQSIVDLINEKAEELRQQLARRRVLCRPPTTREAILGRAGIASRLNYGERFNEYPDRIPHKRGKEISKEVQHG